MLFVLTDLGYGDCAKGQTCYWLCNKYGAHTVVRTGGPQAMHNVVTSDGREFCHSQFGAGTLTGASTFLSKNILIDPYAILNEGRFLISNYGISDAFEKMFIDQNCLVISPFQAVANKLREMARGKGRYGSVGIGVGETICDSEKLGEDGTIRVSDFVNPRRLAEKLENIRQLKLKELAEIICRTNLPDKAQKYINVLHDQSIAQEATKEFQGLARLTNIVTSDFLGSILDAPGHVVFEPSQGVLLDRWYGFQPYTTLVNPKQNSALELIGEQDYSGEMIKLGIMRAYQTRHGAGPFVTEAKYMLRPDVHNTKHLWQGSFRVGHLDSVATRYAIEVSGGSSAFDGLVVSCLDRLPAKAKICDRYVYTDGEKDDLDKFLTINDGFATGIKVRAGLLDQAHLNHQARLAQLLGNCRPVYDTVPTSNLLTEIEARLNIPVVLASYGPTELDRKETSDFFRRVA